ncbi:hypothetical protein A3F06_01740 [candidate division TM6 bacterium RIFCSPHIGHO2_12_FULL_36_22]|nr:MAG: hypothetical protein A3F06_01740 [candidate division TM6 bacterium RIFCSPHIGHO2_12_FULL_36_22]
MQFAVVSSVFEKFVYTILRLLFDGSIFMSLEAISVLRVFLCLGRFLYVLENSKVICFLARALVGYV